MIPYFDITFNSLLRKIKIFMPRRLFMPLAHALRGKKISVESLLLI
jgi:hypothetical protein